MTNLTCIKGGVEIRRDTLIAQHKMMLREIASRSNIEQDILRDIHHPIHREVLASVIDAVLDQIPSMNTETETAMIPETHTRHFRMVNPRKPKTAKDLVAALDEGPLTVFIPNDQSEEQAKEEPSRFAIVIGLMLIAISDFWDRLRGR